MWNGHLVHPTSRYVIAFMRGYSINRVFLTSGRTTKEVMAHIREEIAVAELLCNTITVVLHVFKKAQILKERLILRSILHLQNSKVHRTQYMWKQIFLLSLQ
jgi:hypothetical protein